MGKIIIIHVYEEEKDSSRMKNFINKVNPNEDKEMEEAIHDLCGTNEQTYDRVNGYN